MKRVAIIGAGVCGLTAARSLEREGCSVAVFEREAEVGGAARTRLEDGWRTEWGPNTLSAGQDTLDRLASFGLAECMIEASPLASRRYLVKNGAPTPLPGKPPEIFGTKLFSVGARLRLIRELFVGRAPEEAEESVAGFVRRRLGEEWLVRAVAPFISGVYAGDPEKLSLKHALPRMHALETKYGSLIRGAVKMKGMGGRKLYSTRDGVGGLTSGLAEGLADLRLGTAVESMRRDEGRWIVRTAAGDDAFDTIVLTVSAPAAAELVRGVDTAAADVLQSVYAPPIVVVHHGYRREKVAHPLDGFGMLMPRIEGIRTLGTLFMSTMFPDRAPEGHVLLTSYVGGALDTDVSEADPADIAMQTVAEHRGLLGIEGEPAYVRAHLVRQAIPQYNLGYGRILAGVKDAESRQAGLLLRGNYIGGVALPDRIAAGVAIASEIQREEHA